MKTNKLYLAIPLMLVSSFVFPIGMGEIRVESFINQPFSAEIPLLDVGITQLSAIKASLATPDEFERIGIEQPSIFLPDFKFDVVKNINGQPVIKISSIDRVSEPYVQILVDLAWLKGEIYRTYSVLLDPPGYKLSGSGNNGTSSYKKFVRKRRASGYRNTDYAPVTIRLETPEIQPKDIVYGPTKVNENIWQISQRYSVSGTTLQQIILAIVGTNSQAFTQGNLNGLKIGEQLRVPSTEEILKVPVELARQEVDAHDLAWKSRQEIRHVLLPPYISGVVGVSQFDQNYSDSDSLPSIIPQAGQFVQNILELPIAISNAPFASVRSKPENDIVPAISYLPPVQAVGDKADSLSLRKQLAEMQEKNDQLEKALLQKNKDFKPKVLLIHASDEVGGKQMPESKAGKPDATATSSNFWLHLLLLSGLAGAGAFVFRMRQMGEKESPENGIPSAITKPFIEEPVPTETPVDETSPPEVEKMVSVDDSTEIPVTNESTRDTISSDDNNHSVSTDESPINTSEKIDPIENEESINSLSSDDKEVLTEHDNILEYEPGFDTHLSADTSPVITPVISTEPDNSLEYSLDSMHLSPTTESKEELVEPFEKLNDEIVFYEEPEALENDAQSDSLRSNPDSQDKTPKLVKSKAALDTLLALAKTYTSMEDYELANHSLNELLAFGDDNQKEEAQKLMDEINNKS